MKSSGSARKTFWSVCACKIWLLLTQEYFFENQLIPHFRTLGGMGTSFGCSDFWDWLSGQLTTLRYWSMVRKVTINQSWVTLVHTNDPWNRCAERLYPFPLYFWSGEQDTLNVPVSRKPDCPLPALLTDQNQKLCTTCSHQRECYEQLDPRNQAK